MPEDKKKTVIYKDDNINKYGINEDKVPCPCSNMKCPCGCGYRYTGICLRKNPCIECLRDKSNNII